jgi:hypothetical protein
MHIDRGVPDGACDGVILAVFDVLVFAGVPFTEAEIDEVEFLFVWVKAEHEVLGFDVLMQVSS